MIGQLIKKQVDGVRSGVSQDLFHLPCGQAIIGYGLAQVRGVKENQQGLAAESLTAAAAAENDQCIAKYRLTGWYL